MSSLFTGCVVPCCDNCTVILTVCYLTVVVASQLFKTKLEQRHLSEANHQQALGLEGVEAKLQPWEGHCGICTTTSSGN